MKLEGIEGDGQEKIIKIYIKKRNLLLLLIVSLLFPPIRKRDLPPQANEMERLSAWLNPLGDASEDSFPAVEQWMKMTMSGEREERLQ